MTIARREYEGGCKCQTCKRLPDGDQMTDAQFDEWLKAHPMDPITQEIVEGMVRRLHKRLTAKPGPKLNL